MNKRIKELDQQAVDYANNVCDANGIYKGKEYLTVVKEKFAELIVRECAKFCDDKNSKLLGTMMKEHFGVEE